MVGAPSEDAIVNRCNFTPGFHLPITRINLLCPLVFLKVKAEMKPSSTPVCFRLSGGDKTVTVIEHADSQTRIKFSLTFTKQLSRRNLFSEIEYLALDYNWVFTCSCQMCPKTVKTKE